MYRNVHTNERVQDDAPVVGRVPLESGKQYDLKTISFDPHILISLISYFIIYSYEAQA